MEQIKNFFKFLEDKEGITPPLKYKLIHDPKSITPEDLNVKGDLSWAHPQLPPIPDNLTVGGNLDLMITKITSLPNNLRVGGDLYLGGSKITSLPNNLQIEGNIYLRGTSLADKYTTAEIRKMVKDKGGNIGGGIYL
jgi:hypothetical protein